MQKDKTNLFLSAKIFINSVCDKKIDSLEKVEFDIGILSIDIDGNDYWVLNAIDCVRPRILICEYNNIFGGEGAYRD